MAAWIRTSKSLRSRAIPHRYNYRREVRGMVISADCNPDPTLRIIITKVESYRRPVKRTGFCTAGCPPDCPIPTAPPGNTDDGVEPDSKGRCTDRPRKDSVPPPQERHPTESSVQSGSGLHRRYRPMETIMDNRSTKRFTGTGRVDIQMFSRANWCGMGDLMDSSLGGAGFRTSEAFKRGAILVLRVNEQGPDSASRLHREAGPFYLVTAKVRWCREVRSDSGASVFRVGVQRMLPTS